MAAPNAESDILVLQELCPSADREQIDISLTKHCGNLELAAQDILGILSDPVDGRVAYLSAVIHWGSPQYVTYSAMNFIHWESPQNVSYSAINSI